MIGWHHQLSGHEFEQTPGDSEGQGSLVCCSSWGRVGPDLVAEQQQQRAQRVSLLLSRLSADPSAFTSTWDPTPQFSRSAVSDYLQLHEL